MEIKSITISENNHTYCIAIALAWKEEKQIRKCSDDALRNIMVGQGVARQPSTEHGQELLLHFQPRLNRLQMTLGGEAGPFRFCFDFRVRKIQFTPKSREEVSTTSNSVSRMQLVYFPDFSRLGKVMGKTNKP